MKMLTTTDHPNVAQRHAALRETAHRYLAEIDALSRNNLPSNTVEKLRGTYVVLQAIAAGQRTTTNSAQLGEWCNSLLADVRRNGRSAPHSGWSPAVLHLTLMTGTGILVPMLGLNNSLLFSLFLLVWLGYVYCVVQSKILPYVWSDRLLIEGSMKKRTSWLRKMALALALVASATILGMTFGIGGVIFALAVGIAFVLRARLYYVKPQPLHDANHEDINPATGAPMIPGGLVDSRGNPWGMRNRD